jgi:hypothetical protein
MKGSHKYDEDLEEIKNKRLEKKKVLNLRKKRKQKEDERSPKDKSLQHK